MPHATLDQGSGKEEQEPREEEPLPDRVVLFSSLARERRVRCLLRWSRQGRALRTINNACHQPLYVILQLTAPLCLNANYFSHNHLCIL